MALYNELKRRNVFRVSVAYLVMAWLLVQAADQLSAYFVIPGWVNSLLALALILGFPILVLFAWAFEITPEGLKREKDVDRARSITHLTGRRLDYIIIALLIIAAGYFAARNYVAHVINPADRRTDERGRLYG